MTPTVPPVVDAAWLRGREGVVLADVRWYLDGRSGRAAYDGGHLPGAVFVDLDGVLAAPASDEGGRHPLPSPEAFAAGLGSCGIGDDSVVVAYDDQGGVVAARLVWLLRATGHEAALLDGGLPAWDGPLSTDAPVPAPRPFAVRPWPQDRLAGPDDAADPQRVVLDARPRERYEGAPDDLDPRAGHVPGALNHPCREDLDADGRLLPAEVLRERFVAEGAGPGADVVACCGSGVTACHVLLSREHAGLGTGRLYPGSWSQWSRSDRPAETGPGRRPRPGA